MEGRKGRRNKGWLFTLHAHARAGGYVIGAGVHLYVCICDVYMYVTQKKFRIAL